MAISGNNVAQSSPTTLDPNFFLPPGVVDLRYINEEDVSDSMNDVSVDPSAGDTLDEIGGAVIDVGDGEVLPTDGQPTTNYLQAPSTMSIVSQTVKVAPDGRFVVDVVIDVEDVPGAANYEVRLSKA